MFPPGGTHAEVPYLKLWGDAGALFRLMGENSSADPSWPGFSECAEAAGTPNPSAPTLPPPLELDLPPLEPEQLELPQ